MAVIPTGAIYKSLFFDGESSRNYGVYITGEAVYNAPVRDVEMIKIPGRNGEFALDNGRFENIEVTYPAGIFADNEADFAEAISDFRNFLASRTGYCRLEDDYNPTEYRMAVYKSGLDVDAKVLKAGEFDITFDCKPQRWLKDGESAVTMGEWGETETASGDIVTVENPNGILAVKSLEVDLEPIQDLNGYSKPWVGGAGKNLFVKQTSDTRAGVTFTVNSDGSIKVDGTATSYCFIQKTGVLKAGTYILSGSASGKNFPEIQIRNNATDALLAQSKMGETKRLTLTEDTNVRFRVVAGLAGEVLSNVTVYPQLELGSSATAYEPYENICPISGHTEVVTQRTGKNLIGIKRSGINAQGEIVSQNNGVRSEIIPVKEGDKLRFSKEVTFESSGANLMIRRYDANRNFIGSTTGLAYNKTSNTYTVPSGTSYVGFVLFLESYSVTDAEIDACSIMATLNDTDAAYEPYQGTTYTTALGRTVYGGTLDVVSGVLTDKMGITTITQNSDISHQATGSTRFYVACPDMLRSGDYRGHVFCDKLQTKAGYGVDPNTDAYISVYPADASYPNQNWIYFSNGTATTVAEIKEWLADNPLQLVYELATPQTYQLTAQQIELLTGDNNIWSDSGDITLEYGQNPSVLFNPTLFESSPLLETAGSGSIQFNGYSIDFEGVPIGEVQIAEKKSWTMEGSAEFTFDTTLLNTDDPIYPEAREFEISTALKATFGKFIDEGIISSTNVLDAHGRALNKTVKQFNTYMVPDLGDGFVYGTAKTITCSAIFHYQYGTATTSYWRETVEATIAYGGADSYTVTVQRRGNKSSNVTRNDTEGITTPTMYGDSSKPNNDPIFIDCDLGEAYTNEGGVYRSLNQYIDLGSELPTLGIGANEVTFDNTITELKVTPRWWKV